MNSQRERDRLQVLIFYLLASALECLHRLRKKVKELKTIKGFGLEQ